MSYPESFFPYPTDPGIGEAELPGVIEYVLSLFRESEESYVVCSCGDAIIVVSGDHSGNALVRVGRQTREAIYDAENKELA